MSSAVEIWESKIKKLEPLKAINKQVLYYEQVSYPHHQRMLALATKEWHEKELQLRQDEKGERESLNKVQEADLICRTLRDRMLQLLASDSIEQEERRLVELADKLESERSTKKHITEQWNSLSAKVASLDRQTNELAEANEKINSEIVNLEQEMPQVTSQLASTKRSKRERKEASSSNKRLKQDKSDSQIQYNWKSHLLALSNTNMDPNYLQRLQQQHKSLPRELDALRAADDELQLQLRIESLLLLDTEAAAKESRAKLDQTKISTFFNDGINVNNTSLPLDAIQEEDTQLQPHKVESITPPPSTFLNIIDQSIFRNEYLYLYFGLMLTGLATSWHYQL